MILNAPPLADENLRVFKESQQQIGQLKNKTQKEKDVLYGVLNKMTRLFLAAEDKGGKKSLEHTAARSPEPDPAQVKFSIAVNLLMQSGILFPKAIIGNISQIPAFIAPQFNWQQVQYDIQEKEEEFHISITLPKASMTSGYGLSADDQSARIKSKTSCKIKFDMSNHAEIGIATEFTAHDLPNTIVGPLSESAQEIRTQKINIYSQMLGQNSQEVNLAFESVKLPSRKTFSFPKPEESVKLPSRKKIGARVVLGIISAGIAGIGIAALVSPAFATTIASLATAIPPVTIGLAVFLAIMLIGLAIYSVYTAPNDRATGPKATTVQQASEVAASGPVFCKSSEEFNTAKPPSTDAALATSTSDKRVGGSQDALPPDHDSNPARGPTSSGSDHFSH